MSSFATRRIAFGVVGLAALVTGTLHAQIADRGALRAVIDSIANAPIDSGAVAGMSIAVVRGDDTIALAAYGHADLELDVATPDRAVYEIGSVTKQFTAAAILQLRERGQLTLDDELTQYLPDYPTRGHAITIRRLLDHTSGIRGYTEMPVFWRALVARRLPRDSLVALFSAEPFDFAPGEAMIYNNSAYFLLGLVIAEVSGQPYEAYVQEHLFEPAGMPDSRYCSKQDLIERRTTGYELVDGRIRRAQHLVHVWPYAAGSLCSTVGDLVAWNRALHGSGDGGPLLTAESYRELITPGTLNDGTRLRYAKGLTVTEPGGRRLLGHGGGIFGYVSDLRYYPEHDLTIAVLINTTGGASPGGIAQAIEEAVLGERQERPVRTFAGDPTRLIGTYQGRGRRRDLRVTVAGDSAGLTLSLGTGEPRRLHYLEGRTFGVGSARCTFVEREGAVVELRMDQVAGYYILRKVEP